MGYQFVGAWIHHNHWIWISYGLVILSWRGQLAGCKVKYINGWVQDCCNTGSLAKIYCSLELGHWYNIAVQWCYMNSMAFQNHSILYCLFYSLFKLATKKHQSSTLLVPLCGETTDGKIFHTQRVSNMESISMSWSLHVCDMPVARILLNINL